MTLIIKIKKHKGDSITQYAIIISLIALFLVPAFVKMGETIFSIIENYTGAYEATNTEIEKNLAITDKKITSGSLKAGDLGGTPDNPQVKCVNGVCSVDFGDYVFNNLPKNFKDFVESSGFSGGTKILASMLEEIANQAEPLGDPGAIDLIKQLANQGHIIADFEKQLELAATDALNDPEANIKSSFVVPSKMLINGQYRNNFEKTYSEILERYQSLPDKENHTSLYTLIMILSDEILLYADLMAALGEEIKNKKFTEEELQKIIHPQASTITHLDSAIICATGEGEDSGYSCN